MPVRGTFMIDNLIANLAKQSLRRQLDINIWQNAEDIEACCAAVAGYIARRLPRLRLQRLPPCMHTI